MNYNNKKKILYLCLILYLLSFIKNHKYKPNYEIINKDVFAKYSEGNVYIENEEDLKKINYSENDILICDKRKSKKDPDIEIYDSNKVKDKEIRNEILEIICEYEKMYPSDWNRSIESMRLEWYVHNVCYEIKYKRGRTTNVDLNNDDEDAFDNKLLLKILKL